MAEIEAAVEVNKSQNGEEQPQIKKRRAAEQINEQIQSEQITNEQNATNGVIKNGFDKDKIDEIYFASYSDIELHRTMIEDSVRTNTYHKAIFNDIDFKDKVVCDVGCGTGILSLFCAQAGAKKVYAIEASQIAIHARQLIQANGFQDTITVIQGKAEEVVLPEQVDIIVSEWMGYMLLYETMLPSVLYIRDKWLKPGGKMYPERAVLYMALCEAQWITKYEEGTYDFWISLNHVYDLDMSMLADHAVHKYKDVIHVHMVGQEDVLSFPTKVCDLDLYTIQPDTLRNITHTFKLSSMGSRQMNSLVLWFDCYFPSGLKLSTSADTEDTHWQNTVLPLATVNLKQDSEVKGEINITQDLKNHRFLNIDLKYCVEDGKEITKSFKMDDNCNDNDF